MRQTVPILLLYSIAYGIWNSLRFISKNLFYNRYQFPILPIGKILHIKCLLTTLRQSARVVYCFQICRLRQTATSFSFLIWQHIVRRLISVDYALRHLVLYRILFVHAITTIRSHINIGWLHYSKRRKAYVEYRLTTPSEE